MNLLFTNAGRRTYLVQFALDLRRERGYPRQVFVSDTTEDTAAMWVAPEVQRFLTPRVDENPGRYADVLLEHCRRYKIEVVIPLMDYELSILAQNKKRFARENVQVIVSAADVVERTLDKRRCDRFCREMDLPMPRTWFEGDELADAVMPLIQKRVMGSGSVDLARIGSREAMPASVPSGFMFQEWIPGQEYGMDVLNDLNGNYVHCCLRRKIAMRAGETDKAEVVYDERLLAWGPRIGAAFGHVGNLDLDVVVDPDGTPYFIDFNPRFGGGYPFTHAAGFNYLAYLLSSCSGERIDLPVKGKRISGAKGLSLYYREIDR